METIQRLQRMIEAAETKIIATTSDYQTANDGRFQVYLTPVRQRTRAMKAHYRVGYYMSANGTWKRVNKARFIAEMDAEAYCDRVHVALEGR
jgi:hypothetical protein